MKKYLVEVQFDVKSIDLLEIEVEANSREEARVKALVRYETEEDPGGDMYPSDYMEYKVRENLPQWEVSEIKDANA